MTINSEIQKMINQLFSTTLDQLLSDIPSEFKAEMQSAYSQHLIKRYGEVTLPDANKTDDYVTTLVNRELREWGSSSPEMKMSAFLKDEFLDKIGAIAEQGFSYASKKLIDQTTISPETAKQNIEMLKQYLPQVRSFNVLLAQSYVSEGILDFQYAAGLTENISLRLGRSK